MNVMLGCKNVYDVSDVLYTICYIPMQCWKIRLVMSYIVLSFMFTIIRCRPILCYLFMFVIIMFMG